jgi:hypothetical protein
MRTLFLIVCFLLSAIPVAKAEYRLRLTEIDEMGALRALASWTCSRAGMSTGTECRQQVEISLGGKSHLVQVQFIIDDGHTVGLRITADGYLLQAQRSRALYLPDGDGMVGGSYELWATGQKAEPAGLIKDLTFRPAFDLSTAIGLVVERVTANVSK